MQQFVFDGKYGCLGCNRNGQFSSQVAEFRRCDVDTPRCTVVTAEVLQPLFIVMHYMTGGKYGGLPISPISIYSNDVWRLESENAAGTAIIDGNTFHINHFPRGKGKCNVYYEAKPGRIV